MVSEEMEHGIEGCVLIRCSVRRNRLDDRTITGSRDRTIRVWDINTYQCSDAVSVRTFVVGIFRCGKFGENVGVLNRMYGT